MKRKWIFLSLATGLILLAGVLFIDFYRNLNANGKNSLQEFTLKEEDFDAAPVIREDDPQDLSVVKETGTADETETTDGTDQPRREACSADFTVFGDVLLHENVLSDGNRNAGGSGMRDDWSKGFDFKPVFEDTSDLIENADFALINQASLVGGNDATSALSGYPRFNGPSSIADDYASLGIDGVNIATNHALDLESEGWKNAVLTWKSKSVHAIGAYRDEAEIKDEYNKIIEINGLKIAFFSYVCDTNLHLIRAQDLGIPYASLTGGALKKQEIIKDISSCRPNADAVIVYINWACDASFEETDFQRETARFLADAGADIILGNGPKVLQKVEWITGSAGKKCLCAYSLGNSLCSMQFIENLLGGVLQFTVERDISGAVTIKNVVVEPTMIVYDSSIRNIRLKKLSHFDEASFDAHGSNLLYGKGEYGWLIQTVKKQIPEPFLPASYR